MNSTAWWPPAFVLGFFITLAVLLIGAVIAFVYELGNH